MTTSIEATLKDLTIHNEKHLPATVLAHEVMGTALVRHHSSESSGEDEGDLSKGIQNGDGPDAVQLPQEIEEGNIEYKVTYFHVIVHITRLPSTS